ncbi:MAG: hypothetical protein ABFC81_01205 [Rectinema sp.]
MKHKDVIVHLISEVSRYILEGDPGKMVISLHREADGIHLCVLDDRARSEGEMEAVARSLNASSRPELAGYYGTMAGHDLLGQARLNLVGWQIKHAEVERTPEGGAMLNLWIGGEAFDDSKFTMPKGKNGSG